MSLLQGKKAVVTGASSGIGRAIALAMAAAGATVILNYRQSVEQAQQVADEIKAMGVEVGIIKADISDQKAIAKMLAHISERYGEIDIWVNNAGADILTGAGAQLSDTEKLQRLLRVDLCGTIYCCWQLIPYLRPGGTIINMAWDLAMHGLQGKNPQMFAASKAGIIGFSRSLARTLAPQIRVNIAAPGWIDTAFCSEHMTSLYRSQRLRDIPLGRFGTPEDVAGVVVFLASDAAAYMTGEMIKINGGLS